MATNHQFALLLVVAAIVGIVALLLRQSLLVYIVVGILLEPSALGWVPAHDQVDPLAQIGVTVLLFVVSLRLDRFAGPGRAMSRSLLNRLW